MKHLFVLAWLTIIIISALSLSWAGVFIWRVIFKLYE